MRQLAKALAALLKEQRKANDEELARLEEALSVFDWVAVHEPHLDWNLASANRHLRRLTQEYYDRCFE